jgi:hypothetical protein
MKRAKVLLIILLLCFIITTGTASSFHINKSNFLNQLQNYSNKVNDLSQNSKDTDFNDFLFEPIDIQLEDDAFHGPKGLYSYEWWYFDASLDNGYSVQISIRVLNVLNRVFFTTGLNVYKDGDTVSDSQKIYYKEEVTVSIVEPLVKLDGKEIMKGYIDNDTGDWIYLLNLEMNNISVDFTFVGETKGWKGLTQGIGWWGVILPRANVTGTLTLNGIEMDVSGIGYHDHNWYVTAVAGVNYGWYWGKIYSSTYTITWADVKLTRFSEKPFVVFNKKDGGYINIPPDSIKLTTAGVQFNNGRFIPTSFRLLVDYEDIRFGIDMDVLGTHHFRRFGFINYWRYHLHCYGYGYDTTIEEGQTEIIDEYNMAELLRFR